MKALIDEGVVWVLLGVYWAVTVGVYAILAIALIAALAFPDQPGRSLP